MTSMINLSTERRRPRKSLLAIGALFKGPTFRISDLKFRNSRDPNSHYQTMSYWSHRPIDNEDEDVDDFDEFDPTPYGGGYDIHLTYGRPIKPSEETCYQIASGGDDSVNYDRPNYSSHSEPSAYADEVLDNEYSSYSRPKSGGGRRPSASGGPGPAYGFQPGLNRPGYGEEEIGSGYGRRPEYEEQPPPPRSEYGRRPGYGGDEEEPPRRFGRPGYGGEEEEPPRRFGRPEYGGGEEEEPPRRFGRAEYGEGEEEERPRYGRRDDGEEEERPKYGYGGEEGHGRKKHVSVLIDMFPVPAFD